LHYDNLNAEYNAALHHAILLDRSHEGRLMLTGSSRYELLNRMSTNKITPDMAPGEGRATIFTNSTARIIDRVMVYNRDEHLLLITQPGRGEAVQQYLQRNIFFNDDAQLTNRTESTRQLALHGPQADSVMQVLNPDTFNLAARSGMIISVENTEVFVARRRPLSDSHWLLVVPVDKAATVYEAVLDAGQAHDLIPAGSLTYNTLRIRAGVPAGRELSSDYLPLEVGLWDEVHFDKGCYTGQEIIARMESRARLAKTLVALETGQFVEAPAAITDPSTGRSIGTLTSSVQAPTGDIFTMAVVKTDYIEAGTVLAVGDDAISATVTRLLGEQPDFITQARG
jgi:aminomethyltransferase